MTDGKILEFRAPQKPTSHKSELEIAEDFYIRFSHDAPNLWWQFWQWVFFGFRWSDINEEEK